MEKATLWMGDLEPWMDENWIKQLWLSVGEIVINVKLIKDKLTGINAGYAFVDFSSVEAANRVLSTLNGTPILDTGRIFKLNWAAGCGPANQRDNGLEYTIHVSNLGPEINDYLLYAFFQSRYPGSCKGAKIVIEPISCLSKGYGFVKFTDESEQQRAMIEMQGQYIGNRQINCSPAMTRITSSAAAFPAGNGTMSGYRNNHMMRHQRQTTYIPTYAMNFDPNGLNISNGSQQQPPNYPYYYPSPPSGHQ